MLVKKASYDHLGSLSKSFSLFLIIGVTSIIVIYFLGGFNDMKVVFLSLFLSVMVVAGIHLSGKVIKKVRQLKEAYRARDDFITIASHQLRTPISISRGYASMLAEETFEKLDKEHQEYLKEVENGLNRLNLVVNDIIEVAKLEEGQFMLNLKQESVSRIILDTVSLLRQKAEKKGLSLVCTIDPILANTSIKVDSSKISGVIKAIVDNAINYTEEGAVMVDVKDEMNKVAVRIKDTGIGIPNEMKERVFERFVRLENAKKIQPDGTGVGLYLAKKIVENHKGKLFVNSELGNGTEFIVVLRK